MTEPDGLHIINGDAHLHIAEGCTMDAARRILGFLFGTSEIFADVHCYRIEDGVEVETARAFEAQGNAIERTLGISPEVLRAGYKR